jgi:CRISPR type III-B/RAMP module RAMP protein Cmr1
MLDTKEFSFKVVTPLYLGGVDPRADEDQAKRDTQIRLRPVLAMWRYWLRALKGAELGTRPKGLAEMERQEQRLFGGVRGEHPTAAGIRARLIKVENVEHFDYTEREPDKSRYGRYLGYGLQEQRRSGVVTENRRWAIKPGCEFTIAVTAAQSDLGTLEDVIDTWVHCSGLGARHRRGWGCIEWTNRPQREDYFKWLAERMKQYEGNMSTEPEFDVLHPDWCRIQICNAPSGEPFTSVQDALAAIRNQLRIDTGAAEQEELERSQGAAVPLDAPRTPPSPVLHADGYGWRQRWPGLKPWNLAGLWNDVRGRWDAFYWARDHHVAEGARDADGGHSFQLRNIMFGLPVAYPRWKMTVEAMLRNDEAMLRNETLRRPSPISFRVLKQAGKFKVAVLLFKSRFLPDRALISARVRGRARARIQVPTGSVAWHDLDAFFDACHGDIVFGKGRK